MISFVLGQKVGMTRIFDEDGRDIPVTVVLVRPNVVTQIKTVEKDGYAAVQIGAGSKKSQTKPMRGHLAAAGRDNLAFIRETIIDAETEDVPTPGDALSCSVFTAGDKVKVTGTSKGKGFSGVIKRHGFSRGPETHGSDHHRAPGSIGSMFPQHVMKGRKLPGHMGNVQVTVKNAEVVAVDADTETVLIKGALPGPRGSMLEIRKVSA